MRPTAEIPLLGRDGSLRAVALVDADMYDDLAVFTWRLATAGYAKRGAGRRGVAIYMHRQVLGLELADPLWGDHVNGNRLDNRRCNLRAIEPCVNPQNCAAGRGSSRYRGVTLDRRTGRWRAGATINGRQRWCGYFETEQEAAEAAVAFRAVHLPFAVERAS